jgi:isopentenyl phosphate kinase
LLNEVTLLCLNGGIPVYPLSPAALIVDNHLQTDIIEKALHHKLVPLLHGDIVFDRDKGVSIYSGDQAVIDVGKAVNADELHFATDGDGIIIKEITIPEISAGALEARLAEFEKDKSGSDASGGFAGKLRHCLQYIPAKGTRIYDGSNIENFKNGFLHNKGGTHLTKGA